MLKDKIVFVTGASSGIGTACAKQFAKAGAKLLLCARRIELLDTLASQLHNEYGVDVFTFQLDVRHHSELKEAIKALPDKWKNVDVLVNNAGLSVGLDLLHEGNIQDWDDMIDTNVKGLLYVTREILPQMVRRNSGHVINIGSISSHQVYPKGAVYCATKHAVKALSEGLRMDLFGTKVRVSSIDPGLVNTNFSTVRFKGDKKRADAVYEGMEPLMAEDVADAVLYCATRPPHINISEVLIMPTDQVSVSMVSRKEVPADLQ
jgi:3-hydroxy acid dehydrogenase / malonic semialdehyde reductase